MFKTPRFVEKENYIQVNLHTPLTFPANGQRQTKSGKKFFSVKDRDNFYNWYTTPISASISHLKPSQTAPMLLATHDQLQSTAPFL